jgi:nucleotide-binding universal stress UspA family protein
LLLCVPKKGKHQMNPIGNTIIVPTDFSAVADCALTHAIGIASRQSESRIILLNIVAKEKEIKDAEKSLHDTVNRFPVPANVHLTIATRIGSIFDAIGNFASENDAKLIVMGTHGVKGMQHILGSYAVKVITNSKVPFIVVQERKFRDGYQNILLPMDFSKETKQKLSMTISVAKSFGSKVHIFYPLASDDHFKQTVANNVALAKNELRINKIEFDVQEINASGAFVKNMLAYAAAQDIDLIAVVNSQESGFPEILAGTDERTIITNDAQIPVLIVNPVKSGYGTSVLFS